MVLQLFSISTVSALLQFLQFKKSQSLLGLCIKTHSLDMLEITGLTLQFYLKAFPVVHCFAVLDEFFYALQEMKTFKLASMLMRWK